LRKNDLASNGLAIDELECKLVVFFIIELNWRLNYTHALGNGQSAGLYKLGLLVFRLTALYANEMLWGIFLEAHQYFSYKFYNVSISRIVWCCRLAYVEMIAIALVKLTKAGIGGVRWYNEGAAMECAKVLSVSYWCIPAGTHAMLGR
jgi:hypothetical protein